MFGQLERRCLERLAEQGAKWPFIGQQDGETQEEEEEQYDEAPGIVGLVGLASPEAEADGIPERLAQQWDDERLTQLQKCRDWLDRMGEKRHKCEQILAQLGDKYQSVAENTSSLHTACDRMMSEQTQLAAVSEQIGASLHYYQQYDWLVKKLATPKLSLTGTLFTQILCTIHECLAYLRAHPQQREAAAYIHKYEQCLSRSLTAIKAGVLADLESCRQDVLYRQSRSSSSAAGAATARPSTTLSHVDDDTFALLYGVFGVKANAIRNAFSQAHQFFADFADYQTVVAECEREYFTIRDQLLRPIVEATIQAICRHHQSSSCSLTRDGCTFLLRLCDDEFRLYRQFFVLDSGDTRASMTPSAAASPSSGLFSFWPVLSNPSNHPVQFDAFIEGLCRILYDTLRPLIIHNPHLETLAQLCNLLKVEMIDERCGVVLQPTSTAGGGTASVPLSAALPSSDMAKTATAEIAGTSRSGFARVMSELVADIVERIVYRTAMFAQSDILDYNPAPGDIVYPERLQMMQDINQQKRGQQQATEPGSKPVRIPPNGGGSSSPLDQHCLWYPTVRRAVMCLSKLYRCLDATVFLNISRELLDACCQSLERAVDKIRELPIEPARATIHGSNTRLLDAELFIVKHLLILREQTSPYRQHAKHQRASATTATASIISRQSSLNETHPISPQLDYSLDLTKYSQSMMQLLSAENRARWFEFGSNNALLSLLLLTPVHVSELQTDSRRIIEAHLKRWCHSMIGHVCGILLGPLAHFQTELDQLQAEQEQRARDHKHPLDVATSDRFSPRALHDCSAEAFKRLKQHWPEIRAAFALYIGVRETEEILLQPVRKAVSAAFTALNAFAERHYGEEQRQVVSAPNQEQIWLILNANA